MYKNASVCVVVPAYNEADLIGDVIDTVPGFVDNVIVVDDYSTDGTWEEIQSRSTVEATEVAVSAGPSKTNASSSLPDGGGYERIDADSFLTGEFTVVRHETNQGRGAAVKTGYRLAMMAGYDVIGVMDGDGQMDPSILDRIIEPVVMNEADYAKGNRLATREHCRQMSTWRLFGNILLTGLTKVASGYWWIRDPQNGYTAVSVEALDELSISDLYDDYGFLNDLLIRLNAQGMRVTDVPMEAEYGDESSGIVYRTFIPMLSLLLLRGFFWRLWTKYLNTGMRERITDADVE